MKLNKISHIIISLFIVFSYSHGKVLDLESYENADNNVLDAYLKEKAHSYDIIDDQRTNTFMNIKLIKNKKKLQSELMSDSLHNHLI